MINNLKNGFIFAGLLLLISACAKTTKGKLANDWKVTSFEQVDEEVENGEVNSIDRISFNGASVSQQIGNSNFSGSVSTHDMTIRKDGTWELTRVYTLDDSPAIQVDHTELGTWNFKKSSKSDQFDKNEFVYFHTLTEKETRKEQIPSGSVETSERNYLIGQKTLPFRIVESERDELKMMMDSKINIALYADVYKVIQQVTIELSEN
jgi:hypothetical protein